MRFSTAVLLASAALLSFGAAETPAWAQVATGNEVTVNPVGGAANGVLLYPGGQYMRVVHPLLQPGESARDMGRVTLHMPGKRRATTAAAPATPKPKRVAATPSRPAPAAAPTPAPAQGYDSGYGDFGPASGAAGLGNAMVATTPPPRTSAPRNQMARVAPPPATTAPMSPPPTTPGLTKQSVILFAAGASEPAQSALDAIKFLAANLNNAMTGAGSRIQILAYGGDKGDKGSDARRLSLKRALAIRQVLIDDGVPSERIDVRAMGGADDNGPQDRVDVYVKV